MSTAISDATYVAFTSHRKDGTPVSVPVWIADLGEGTVGFTTGSESYKVKRVNRDPNVTLQASDAKGEPLADAPVVNGTARVVTGDEYQAVRKKVAAKYGIQFTMISTFGKVRKLMGKGPASDCGIIVRLDEN